MAKPYSNRELDQFFKAADERADTFHQKLMGRMDAFENRTTDSLNRIEVQTSKTNGRVTTLEDETVGFRIWRARIIGALAVLSFLLGMVIIPLVAAYVSTGYIKL